MFRKLTLVSLSITASLGAATAYVNPETREAPEPLERTPNSVVVDYQYTDAKTPSALQFFRSRYGYGEGSSGGISLYAENENYQDWKYILDSKFYADPNLYKVHFKAIQADRWQVDFLWTHTEDEANPNGLFYPSGNLWFSLADNPIVQKFDDLRLSLTFQPNESLKLTAKYRLFIKDGDDLSTRFGTTAPSNKNLKFGRGIIPTLTQERSIIQQVDLGLVKKTDGGLKIAGKIHGEVQRDEDQRDMQRNATDPATSRWTTQKSDSDRDLLGFHGAIEKRYDNGLLLSLGLSHTRLDGNLTGSRIYGTDADPIYDIDLPVRQLDDSGFIELQGYQEIRQWMLNANLFLSPEDSPYQWLLAARVNLLEENDGSNYFGTNKIVDWQQLSIIDEESLVSADENKSVTDISISSELRYTGFSNTLVYLRVDGGEEEGNLEESWNKVRVTPQEEALESLLARNSDYRRAHWKAALGMNRAFNSSLSIYLQGYLKERSQDLDAESILLPDSDWTAYPGFIDRYRMSIKDVNLRIHWKLGSHLKMVSRADLQETTIVSKAFSLADRAENEHSRIVLNHTVTWTPHPRVFLQSGVYHVRDKTETGVDSLEGSFQGVVVTVPSDYWQIQTSAYLILTPKIDFELAHGYLEMDNYRNNSPTSVPYGEDLKEHTATARLYFQLKPGLRLSLGYAFFHRDETSSAGLTNFEVHQVSTRLQYLF